MDHTRITVRLSLLSLVTTLWLAGCGESRIVGTGVGYQTEPGFGAMGSDFAASTEGVQNLDHTRELIARGGIPTADDIAIEGLFREHDLEAPGASCDSLLCARPALARARDLATGEMAYWLHLGIASGLSSTDFVRPPLDLVVVIDKSGSMVVDMDETNEAVTRLLDHLRPDDRLAIIAFDDQVETIKQFGPLGDREALAERVRAIRAAGGWDADQALSLAYGTLEDQSGSSERLRRVMLLSCGIPELASDGRDPFSMRVKNGALQGIGMSFFGILLDYHPQLAALLHGSMGGAFYALPSFDRIVHVFDDDFDAMVTPMAYDLDLSFATSADFELVRLFGVPGAGDLGASYRVDLATAFSGWRQGAVVVRLDAVGDRPVAEMESVGSVALSYLPEPALGWTAAVEENAEVPVPKTQDSESYFTTDSARKAVALANLGQALQSACAAYHEDDVSGAIATLEELMAYLSTEAQALDDLALGAEVELVAQLVDNMR